LRLFEIPKFENKCLRRNWWGKQAFIYFDCVKKEWFNQSRFVYTSIGKEMLEDDWEEFCDFNIDMHNQIDVLKKRIVALERQIGPRSSCNDKDFRRG